MDAKGHRKMRIYLAALAVSTNPVVMFSGVQLETGKRTQRACLIHGKSQTAIGRLTQ